jgi:hypothetical protein
VANSGKVQFDNFFVKQRLYHISLSACAFSKIVAKGYGSFGPTLPIRHVCIHGEYWG